MFQIPVMMTEIKAIIPAPPIPAITLPIITCQREMAIPLNRISLLVVQIAALDMVEWGWYGVESGVRYTASKSK